MSETIDIDQTDLATVLLWVTVSGAPSEVTKAAKRLREKLKDA